MTEKLQSQKGMSVALVLIVIVVLLLIGVTTAIISSRNLGFVNKDKFNDRAFYAAEAGISKALSKLRYDLNWDGKEAADENGNRALTFENTPMQNCDDYYSVLVFNNLYGSSVLTADKGVQVPVGSAYLLSTGYVGSVGNVKAEKQVGVMVKKGNPFDNFGLSSKDSLSFSGSLNVSAYDSDTQQAVPGQGNAATNGNQAGDVSINGGGSGAIDGTVYIGPGTTTDSILIDGNPVITGGTGVLPRELPFPPVVTPNLPAGVVPVIPAHGSVTLAPGFHYGAISISNHQTVELTGPGVYVIDSIDITALGHLVANTTGGPVKIYMNGDINGSGSSNIGDIANVNNNTYPKSTDLLIYGNENSNMLNVRGNASVAMAFYAPATEVRLQGNADFYGAIIADKIDLGGTPNFYYDVALASAPEDVKVIRVSSWQRF